MLYQISLICVTTIYPSGCFADQKMGQNESTFKRTYSDTVSQLSSVQLGEITARFNELYAKAGGTKGLVVDREAFSKYLNLPVAIGDRLFEAFDEKKVPREHNNLWCE